MADIGQVFTGIVLALLTVGLFNIAILDHSSKYNTTLSGEVNNSIHNLSTQFETIVGTGSDTYDTTATTEASQTIDTGIDPKKALAAVKNGVSSMISVSINMLNSMTRVFKVPRIAVAALVIIVVFVLTLTLIALVFKIRP